MFFLSPLVSRRPSRRAATKSFKTLKDGTAAKIGVEPLHALSLSHR